MFEKNLKYFRLKKKMSKKDLAEACNLTPMAITNYENGKRTPDMEMIKKLASALGVKTIDFLEIRNAELDIQYMEYRKKSSLSKMEQEYIKESIEEYFSRLFDTIEILGGDVLPTPPQCHDIKKTGDYNKDAISLRKHLKLQQNGPIDEIVGMLENNGILVVEIDIDNNAFDGMNGFVNGHPYVAIRKNMRVERKRTTLIHELTHLMFDWSDSKDESQNEKDATAIAGAFLISNADIIRELGLKRNKITNDFSMVCDEYGISLYLLVKRAAQADIISSAVEKKFYIDANKSDFAKREKPRVCYPEEPSLLKQLVLRAVYVENINIQKASELLGVSVADVEKYCKEMEVS